MNSTGSSTPLKEEYLRCEVLLAAPPRSVPVEGVAAPARRLVARGTLQDDATQLAAVEALQMLQHLIVQQQALQAAPAAALPGSPASPQTPRPAAATPAVAGAYLWGPVGSGKTLLMDLLVRTLPHVTPLTPPQHRRPAPAAATHNAAAASGDAAPPPAPRALRVHFHEFMARVHRRHHELQEALPVMVVPSRQGLPVHRRALPQEDPLATIATEVAAAAQLLALDELHVTDVADAMVLVRLFRELLSRGCFVAFTSNRPARDLYKHGLSRQYFLPFVRLIDARLLQLRVAGGRDYRVVAAAQAAATAGSTEAGGALTGYLTGADADERLQRRWGELRRGRPEVPVQLPVAFGRSLWVPRAVAAMREPAAPADAARAPPPGVGSGAAEGAAPATRPPPAQAEEAEAARPAAAAAAALFTFEELCGARGTRAGGLGHAAGGGALSSVDYLALCRRVPLIFIQGVPQLGPSARDEARRLVTLVDVAYDTGAQLVVSGRTPLGELFLPLLARMAALGADPTLGTPPSPTGTAAAAGAPVAAAHEGDPEEDVPRALLAEEVLMYHRTVSRLTEMLAHKRT